VRGIGRRRPGLQRTLVVGIGDAVLVGVDQRAAGPLRIRVVSRHRHRAGVVDVGNLVAVLVVLRAARLERIGMFALRDVATQVLVVADAVASPASVPPARTASAPCRFTAPVGGRNDGWVKSDPMIVISGEYLSSADRLTS